MGLASSGSVPPVLFATSQMMNQATVMPRPYAAARSPGTGLGRGSRRGNYGIARPGPIRTYAWRVNTRTLGRGAVAAVVAGMLVVPASASAAKMPKGVESWLGTWHANFGTLRIDDVHRERAEFPDANGKRPYRWAASITWTRPGFRARITGTILGDRYRYRTFAGCWEPDDPTVSCGYVLLQRKGEKLVGGYWKKCRQNCKSHHPWKGKRTSPAWRVGFDFTQRGKPRSGPPGATQFGGAGALISLVEPGRADDWRPTGNTRLFLVAEGPRGRERRLTIEARSASYHRVRDDLPRVILTGRVTASNDERCSVGERVEVILIDGKRRAADTIELDPRRESCDRGARWSSLGNGEVNVFIGFPSVTN